MLSAYTAKCLSKLPYADKTSENELELEKQYAFAVIRYEAVKGNTDAVLYYNRKLIPFLRAEGFKVEKYPKTENRMIISWDHVLAS